MSLSVRWTLPSVLLLTIGSIPAHAVVRTVEIDGSGEYTVIQDALVASTAGDSILVGPGVYSWTNQGSGDDHGLVRYWKDAQDGVHLISTDGPEATILDAEGKGRVFFANGINEGYDKTNIFLKGFTLRNGLASKVPNRLEQEGGAMALHLTTTTVIDCIFENNVAEHGGAVWMGGEGAYSFTNCRFIGNRAVRLKPDMPFQPFGGAMLMFGPPDLITISGCTFIGNHSDYRAGAIGIGAAGVEIRDCLFSANTAASGATRTGTAIYADGADSLRLYGITVRDHDSAPGAAVLVQNTASFEMVRTLVAGTVSGLTVQLSDAGRVLASCTNLFGGFPGDWIGALIAFKGLNGNTQLDPMFCSDSSDLRRVEPASPMIAANNSCGQDIGRIIGNCLSVPIQATSLRGRRQAGVVRLEWHGVDPLSAGLRMERRSPGRSTELDLGRAMELGIAHWVLVDDRAPREDVEYVLRDHGGQELARASLPAIALSPRMEPASPNPFNPRTLVGFELPETGHLNLSVYDSRGRHIITLVDGVRTAGRHEVVFDGIDARGRPLSSGVYYLRLRSSTRIRQQSVVLIR